MTATDRSSTCALSGARTRNAQTAALTAALLLLLGGCPLPSGTGPGSGGPAPDLAPQVIAAPASALPASPVELGVRVCNQGSDWAPPSQVRIALQTVGGMPGWWEDRGLPSLDTGACHDLSATAFVPEGVYTPLVAADPEFALAESDEDNNAAFGVALGVGYGPDWTVRVSDAPPSVTPGTAFAVDVEVCNRGTQPGGAPWIGVYASRDTLVAADPGPGGDPLLGGRPANPLAPGTCESLAVDVFASVPGEGAFYLAAVADPDGFEPELIEDNNEHLGAAIGIGFGPNLVVASLTHAPSAGIGAPLPVDALVCNTGTTPSGPTAVRVALSSDPVWSDPAEDPASDDREIAWMPLPGIDAGACENASASGPAHVAGSDGAYHVIASVDPHDDETELIEDDNDTVAGPVGIGSGPDWIVVALDAPPSVQPGQGFDAQLRVCNQGTLPTGGGHVLLLFSADGSVPGGPAPGGAGIATPPPLSPGSCEDLTVPLFAHPPGDDGPWVLLAVADEGDADPELIESNNAFAGPVVGIGNAPDWVVEAVTLPPSIEPGSDFDVSARVCNQGTQPAPPTDVTFYLSSDTQLTGALGPNPGADPFLISLPVSPLEVGACADVADRAPALPPLEQGAYHAGAIADESDFGAELREDNNAHVGDPVGVGTAPDLRAVSVGGPPSALPGASIDFDFEVCNTGTVASAPTDVGILLHATPDPVTPPPGPPGPTVWAPLPVIEAGACHSGSATGPAMAPNGEGVAYPVLVADLAETVDELIESNNAVAGAALGIGSAPDLRVASIGAPPSAAPGNPVSATVEVCNDGTLSSPPSDALFVLSADAEIESPSLHPGTKDVPLAPVPIPPLLPAECHTANAELFLFPPDGDGAYHLGAIADEFDAVDELIEENNALAGDLVGVGTAPDLRVDSVTTPAAVNAGVPFAIDLSLCNDGTTPSPASDVAILISTDPDVAYPPPVPGPGEFLVFAPAPPVGAGSCEPISLSATTFVPPDSYLLVVLADSSEAVFELREDNNRNAGAALDVTP